MFVNKDMYFVMAGQVYVKQTEVTVFTTLGSCVAVIAWHKKLNVIGMCHYLLAEPVENRLTKDKDYYGKHALATLENKLSYFAKMRDFEFSLFGGGSLFSLEHNGLAVANRNIVLAQMWAVDKGIQFTSCGVGGDICRQVKISGKTGCISNTEYPMSGVASA